MGELQVTCDPAEVGLDPERLRRIDAHFSAYVDDGRLPGWVVLVSRGGEIAHLSAYGARDLGSGAPVEPGTMFRLFSLSKPITSVALMTLYEEGALTLTDPVADYIPSFAGVRVYESGPASAPVTRTPAEPVRIWHLLTHTAGLAYGWQPAGVVADLYREAGLAGLATPGPDLAAFADRVAALPLLFDPGTAWNYSVAVDVLGRVIEVVAGMPFERFLAERVLGPLGMHDTGFHVPEHDRHRVASLYTAGPGGLTLAEPGETAVRRPEVPSGGAGLISTAGDYHRFLQMLLRGGELDGVRVLGSRTVAYMARNHLPGGLDLAGATRTPFGEAVPGEGFGLGFAVVEDAAKVRNIASEGEFHWGGAPSTVFWVDPAEDVTVVFLTQVTGFGPRRIRTRLRQLVHQAIIS